MINILGKIPRKVAVAFSGGIDSMAITDFLNNNHEITLLHFNHGSPMANGMEEFAERTAKDYGCKLEVGKISRQPEKGESLEEYWRNCRYDWFDSLPYDCILTGHHLDDSVETWVWSSMHGTPKLIPYNRGRNIYRPFLITRKSELENWAERQQLAYYFDESNNDTTKTRNYIRHVMMPNILRINPGIHKVIKRKILETEKNLLTNGDEMFNM